jgi:hypothetical protein
MDRMRQNITLTNSDWTGRAVKRLHGITSQDAVSASSGTFCRGAVGSPA